MPMSYRPDWKLVRSGICLGQIRNLISSRQDKNPNLV